MNSNSPRIRTSLIPFYRPISLVDEMEELARGLWTSWRPLTLDTPLSPRTDVYEEDGNLIMKTEPGMEITLTVLRVDNEVEIPLTVGARP